MVTRLAEGLPEFPGAAVEPAEVAAEDDGQAAACAGGVDQGGADAADVGLLGGGEVEDAERVGRIVRRGSGRGGRRTGSTGKPVSMIFSSARPERTIASRVAASVTSQ